MDLDKILIDKKSEKKEKEKEKNEKIKKKYSKPNQLRDIESRSNTNRNNNVKYQTHTSDEINKIIISEKNKIKKQSWNKLNNGTKLKLIINFIDTKKKELKLSNNDYLKLKKILFNACESNKLNKSSDIDYDIELNKINDIKILEIIKKNNNYDFKLKIQINKKKSSTKSKSNIEKLLKLK